MFADASIRQAFRETEPWGLAFAAYYKTTDPFEFSEFSAAEQLQRLHISMHLTVSGML